MIKFIDKTTGNLYNGSKPSYVFWFDGEQSTNIYYSQIILFMSDKSSINFKLPKTDIFSFIDPKILDDIRGIDSFTTNINEIIYKNEEITLQGVPYRSYYIYSLYIIGHSVQPGEYHTNFYIDNEEFEIAADFYNEEESLYINLSNNGIDIPESIQKAFYTSNVYEDKRDNILLNRKWKEMLSNSLDIIFNKGSYKSLINSLKWFEYGDLLKLNEIWKLYDKGIEKYQTRDMIQILSDKQFMELKNATKTTYLAIRNSMNKIVEKDGKIQYNEELNPDLQQVIYEWSIEEMMIKMCILGHFYQTYFMPIHTELIHSTLENLIFTNTIKTIKGLNICREDKILNIKDCKCSVKNGDIFELGITKCYVTEDTMFGTQYEHLKQSEQNASIVGVQYNNDYINTSNDNLKTYTTQLFNDIGVVVDFEIQLPSILDDKKFIKKSILQYKTYNKNEDSFVWEERVYHKKIEKNKFSFHLLCPHIGEYTVRLLFEISNGEIYTKQIKFNVIDNRNICLNLYKIKSNNVSNPTNKSISLLSRQKQINENVIKYFQYIPLLNSNDSNWTGVKLNHFLVYHNDVELGALEENYYIQKIEDHILCWSKEFGYSPESIPTKNLIKNDYIFMPENHRLEFFGDGNTVNDFTITDMDTLCVIPDIPVGKPIDEIEWEFKNISNNTSIKLDASVQTPLIAPTAKQLLSPGYYSIIFRYKIGNEIKTIQIDSAFRKV